ncbi:MAG: hypothetical protein LBV55_04295 [Acholeplasmatales bacterium]|jgi:hypothetical protein|nr:hypothetical protein [Acholeplasmatales bacterium]
MKKSGFIISGIISILVAAGLIAVLVFLIFFGVVFTQFADIDSGDNPIAKAFGALFLIIEIVIWAVIAVAAVIIILLIIFQLINAGFKLSIISKKPQTIKKFKRGTFVVVFDIIFAVIAFAGIFLTLPNALKKERAVYESSDSAIVEISENNIITAISVGSATITIKNSDGSVADSVLVNVTSSLPKKSVISKIEIEDEVINLQVGQTSQLKVTITEEKDIYSNLFYLSLAATILFIAASVLDIITNKQIKKLIKKNNERDDQLLAQAALNNPRS